MKTISILIGIFVLASSTMSFVNSDNWVLFETKSCQIYFPKKPTDHPKILNTAFGELKFNVYMYEVADNENDDNFVYALSEVEYPDSVINSDKKDLIDKFFRGSIDGVVNNVHGKLLSEFIIQFDGYPGREIDIDCKNGLAIIKMRFYLVKNKMYMMQTLTDTKKDFNKSIMKFMDSFRLKK